MSVHLKILCLICIKITSCETMLKLTKWSAGKQQCSVNIVPVLRRAETGNFLSRKE